jgi:hypothetical protein
MGCASVEWVIVIDVCALAGADRHLALPAATVYEALT